MVEKLAGSLSGEAKISASLEAKQVSPASHPEARTSSVGEADEKARRPPEPDIQRKSVSWQPAWLKPSRDDLHACCTLRNVEFAAVLYFTLI